MEQAHARHDLPNYYRVNRAIHDRINAIAGNPILTHTFRTLNARLHALRFRSNLVQAKWDQAVKEHREMIEALAARDGERLRDLLVRHVRTKLRAVLETMNESRKVVSGGTRGSYVQSVDVVAPPRCLAAALAADRGSPAIVRAQAWPTGPITWLNPFPAGGGTDVFARPLAAQIGDQLGSRS